MHAQHLLRIATALHGEEPVLRSAVQDARESGVPWPVIGAALRVTPQAAERRFGAQATS
jgi:hypothetical protein